MNGNDDSKEQLIAQVEHYKGVLGETVCTNFYWVSLNSDFFNLHRLSKVYDWVYSNLILNCDQTGENASSASVDSRDRRISMEEPAR